MPGEMVSRGTANLGPEEVARSLNEKQRAALLAMPFESKNSGHSSSILSSLSSASEGTNGKAPRPALCTTYQPGMYSRRYTRNPFGDLVAAVLERKPTPNDR